jgi:hypothetical protein
MDKDVELEKALWTQEANPAPRWYRKELRSSYRAKTKDVIKKIAKWEIDPDEVSIDEMPKNASRYW